MSHPETDLDRLIAQHPCWAISVIWATANSGPDRRRLVAAREGIRVDAWTAVELSALIAATEAANSGADYRMLTASRAGVTACAPSAGDLPARIADAERLQGWQS